MKCPICQAPVKKVRESQVDHHGTPRCHNEFYEHRGNTLIKYKQPRHDYHKV